MVAVVSPAMSSAKHEPDASTRQRPGKRSRQTMSTGLLLRDRLLATLLQEIAAGKIVEGERFPPRRTLEKVWGVSKETASFAIRHLQRHGLVAKPTPKWMRRNAVIWWQKNLPDPERNPAPDAFLATAP